MLSIFSNCGWARWQRDRERQREAWVSWDWTGAFPDTDRLSAGRGNLMQIFVLKCCLWTDYRCLSQSRRIRRRFLPFFLKNWNFPCSCKSELRKLEWHNSRNMAASGGARRRCVAREARLRDTPRLSKCHHWLSPGTGLQFNPSTGERSSSVVVTRRYYYHIYPIHNDRVKR